MTSRWLCAAALGLAATGCTALCDGDTVEVRKFAGSAHYAEEIAACLEAQACASLCDRLFAVPSPIERCEIEYLVWPDAQTQAIGPATRAIDVGALQGVSVRATFTEQVACATDEDDGSWDWDWDWDDGGDDDGDYDGGGDDDGCWDCGSDDGGDDDGGYDGDDGDGDDGGGDDGGDDDGGTYGDPVRAPTNAPRA